MPSRRCGFRAGTQYNVTTGGRFILSSLEQNSSGGQWIHWQRCIGTGNFTSSYGTQGTGSTGTSFAGMGPSGSVIKAPAQNAVMFVEAYYVYKPLVSSRLFGTPTIHTTSAFLSATSATSATRTTRCRTAARR